MRSRARILIRHLLKRSLLIATVDVNCNGHDDAGLHPDRDAVGLEVVEFLALQLNEGPLEAAHSDIANGRAR